jgi:lipopolysaccharide/colanic/teichoic acid biosynthesis glycosyltransferase
MSLFCLAVLSPVILITAILVKFKLGSPVVFSQERPGKNEKIFTLYKFRTMTDGRGPDGELLPDGERLTRFGAFLRSSSLDELPELLNIVKGDMSLVGPRPLLVEYLPYYNEFQKRRHNVRPGLTGLAQINGRNAATWDERLRFDAEYVDNVSFKQDMKIICRTAGIVFRREGISAENHATMESFIEYLEKQQIK